MKFRDFVKITIGLSTAALPVSTYAQQTMMPVIGFMSGRSAQDSEYLLDAIREGLRETGYVEGENLSILYRWANGDYAKIPGLASELLSLSPVGGSLHGNDTRNHRSTYRRVQEPFVGNCVLER